MVEFHEQKFPDNLFDVISTKELEDKQSEDALLSVKTTDGSSKFQIVVFTLDSKQIKAASRLCICDNCLVNYGTCDRFISHDLFILHLNKVTLRSSAKPDSNSNGNADETVANEFIVPGTVVALAADLSSIDIVWFVEIVKVCLSQEDEKDDHGHTIRDRHEHVHGQFLEKTSTSTGHHFKLSKKVTFFWKESVVYPFIQLTEIKKGFKISDIAFIGILQYVEETGLTSL